MISVCGAAVSRGDDSPDFTQTGKGDHGGQGQNRGGNQDGNAGSQNGGNQKGGSQNDGGPIDDHKNHGADKNRGDRDGGSQTGDGRDFGSPDDGWLVGRGRSNPVSREDLSSPPMDLDGARENFATIVETYVSKKSNEGWWSYVETKEGKKLKPRCLAKPSVDEESVKQKEGSRFSGLVTLDDAGGGQRTLEFVVDFSGAKWKVISVKPPAPVRVSSRQ